MSNGDERMTRGKMSMRAALCVPAMALFALSACGGSNATNKISGTAGSTGGTGVVAGTAGSSPSGTAGSSASGTAGSSASGTAGSTATGTGGTGPTAGVAVCTKYCNAIMTACTGANQQYSDMANCLKVCSYMQAGQPTDTSGDSASCRANKVSPAPAATALQSACFQAGPLGYGGGCGEDCDTFCAVALNYCSAAGGYAGAPLYKDVADCLSTCGQFNRVIDYSAPGHYGPTYTPGPTPETKDTLECRGYHLFINALATVGQATHCPHAANNSAVCGPGIVPIDPDAGTTASDGPITTYDGGLVNIINSTNWDETKFPPDKRKMLLRDEGDPHLVMIDLSKTPILQWKTVAGGPWARASQLIGNNEILGGRNDGYEVFDYTTGMIKKTVNSFGNTQSAYRTVTGETMLTRSGTILTFLDKTDKMSHQISYPGYGYVRVARPTRNGTYLVPSDTTMFEGDATGKVLWKANGAEWGHIWEPLLLGPSVGGGMWNDGDTLLCTAFGSSCDVIDKVTHKVGFRFGTKRMVNAAAVRPNFFSEYEILPNGNIFCSNWQGHGAGNGGSGIQVLEFNPKGEVIWFWKQDPTIFSSIQGVQVMDGKDPKYLHVQETSPNSTWQPVMNQ
jgi:hypothetical protein